MLANGITFLGFILLLLGILGYVYGFFRGQTKQPDGTNRPRVSAIGLLTLIIAGIILMSIQNAVFYAEPGFSYLVQYPNGTQKAVLEPGFHTRWFGDVIPFKKYLTIAFVGEGDPTDFSGVRPKQSIRFNDSVTSDVRMTARFQLPESEEHFLQMALAFRSQENLINSSLVPTAQESMRNSGRMFSAQEYIGGRGGDFENAVLDQIRNGIYLLDVTEEKIFSGQTDSVEEGVATIQQDQTIRVTVSIRRGSDGQEMRKDAEDHPLKKFEIQLVQANIQDVDPDVAFKEKLTEQREAAAQVSIERQLTRQEEERKKRIIAQGEAEKAEKKIELEKIQIEEVTAAETEALKAEQDKTRMLTEATASKEVSEISRDQKAIELETAKLEAERIQTLAEAEAAGRRAIFEADNALEQRLEAWVQINQAYASALQNKQLVPTIVMGGGDDGGQVSATDLISLLVAQTAKDLSVEIGASQPVSGTVK